MMMLHIKKIWAWFTRRRVIELYDPIPDRVLGTRIVGDDMIFRMYRRAFVARSDSWCYICDGVDDIDWVVAESTEEMPVMMWKEI